MKAVEIYAHLEQSHVDDGVVAVAANIGASVKNMRDSCGNGLGATLLYFI